MKLLNTTAQQQVEDVLVENGAISRSDLDELLKQSEKDATPIFSLLVSSGKITDEELTKTMAQVGKIPYVNLMAAKIDPNVLKLLPQDLAERYMAVPLGEMQHRLVVAMLDAGNVQAVDFLSNRVGRPLKVYAASEEGIRQVLHQYSVNISDQVVDDISNMGADDIRAEKIKNDDTKAKKGDSN